MKNFFKNGLLAIVGLIGFGLVSSPTAHAAACGTVATPLACSATLGGLTLTFDNFVFSGNIGGLGSGTAVTASQVNINTVINPYDASLVFTPNNGPTFGGVMTNTQLQQMFVNYRVTLTGTGAITGIMSSFSDMFTGNGSGSQTKDVCTGGPCGAGGTTVSTINLNDIGGTSGIGGTHSGSTAPAFGAAAPYEFYVKDTASLQANGLGTVEMSMFTNSFSVQTPEPMSFVLMGAGLVGIAALRRRSGA